MELGLTTEEYRNAGYALDNREVETLEEKNKRKEEIKMENKNLSLYSITSLGRGLEDMYLNGEIDGEELKDSQEFLIAELENRSENIIKFYKKMTSLIGEGTGQNKIVGAIDQEIDRLKEYKAFLQKGFKKFTTDGANAMLAVGIQSGQSKGIKTANGILFLSKSSKEIKPNPDEVIAKYKIYRIKEFDITDEDFNQLPDDLRDKFKPLIKEVKIDKELYQADNGDFKKEEKYTMKVK